MSGLDEKGLEAARAAFYGPKGSVVAAISAYLAATTPADVGEEPVAWQVQDDDGKWIDEDADMIAVRRTQGHAVRPLYSATALERVVRKRDEARKSWRCFHCDEVFTSEYDARIHFGRTEDSEPGCCIKVGAERGLLTALRHAEADAADAWFKLQNESGEAALAYHAQAARHQEQLRVVEEAGYEKGLRDANHEVTRAELAEAKLAEARKVIERLLSTAETYRNFRAPTDLPEDESQQWQQLEHQERAARRFLEETK